MDRFQYDSSDASFKISEASYSELDHMRTPQLTLRLFFPDRESNPGRGGESAES